LIIDNYYGASFSSIRPKSCTESPCANGSLEVVLI
jgi:hypothetical protein